MNQKKRLPFLIGIFTMACFSTTNAQQGSGFQCQGCEVSFASAQDLANAISDNVGVDPADITITPGDAPGIFRIRLPDDSNFIVAQVGLTFHHQNILQRGLVKTDDGGLHLRSQTRTELQLRSAVHRETEMIGEMLRLGWTNFNWFRYGMQAEAPDGKHYCFQPDMRVYPQTPPAGISVTEDEDGNLVVINADGIRQRLHACSPDLQQIRDQIRLHLHQQISVDTDGVITVPINGANVRYRLSTELRWSDMLDQPGFFYEGELQYFRYRDGWEQQVIRIN